MSSPESADTATETALALPLRITIFPSPVADTSINPSSSDSKEQLFAEVRRNRLTGSPSDAWNEYAPPSDSRCLLPDTTSCKNISLVFNCPESENSSE